ncbi:MAG: AI-2E family transporter [Bacteroidales bacterium]|nr:AI-2E family transporter [Bacteroidales bacterium]
MEHKKITFDLFIRGVMGLAVVIGFLMLLYRLSSVLVPFFLAWLIAYLMFPMVKFFQYKLRLKYRALAILASFLFIGLVLTLATVLLLPPIVSEFARVKDLIVEYFTSNETASRVPAVINQFIQENIGANQIMKLLDKQEFQHMVREALPRVWNMVTESISIVFSIFSLLMVVLYTIFILLDYETISKGWPNLVPERYRAFSVKIMQDISDGMNKYFRGQAKVAFCVGVLFSIGFLIIDLPLAIPLGLFIGMLNMVPYLQIVGFIPTIILAVLRAADTGQNFWVILLLCLIVFAVVQGIQDIFLTPTIMGEVTGLNPAIILLSLSVWGSLMGVLGMIIALPMTTLLLTYYQKYVIAREQKQQETAPQLPASDK